MTRTTLLACIGALLLGGCGNSGETADAPAPVATSANVARSASEIVATNDAAQRAPDGAMPAIFLGAWGPPGGCAGKKGVLTIEPRRVLVDGIAGTIATVELQEPGTAGIDVDLATPNGTTRHSWDLHVAQDGTRLDRIEGGVPDITYFPCAA